MDVLIIYVSVIVNFREILKNRQRFSEIQAPEACKISWGERLNNQPDFQHPPGDINEFTII